MNLMRYQVSRQGDIVDRGVFAVSGPHRVQVEMPTSGRHRTLDVTTQVQALVDSGHVAMDFKLEACEVIEKFGDTLQLTETFQLSLCLVDVPHTN